MSKYRIATKTDSLRYRIAKEVFGEIEDCDGVRDIPSWEIFEKTLEQHKQILSLQLQLAEKDKEQNQKAIEQLEKVKEKFGYKHNSQLVISSKNLVGFIDNQIKQLKEGKEHEIYC